MKLLKSRNSASRKKANSKTISKASQEAIIDQNVINSEIRYVAGDSFRSVASSVTAPPSMTASFYEKALAGWNLDDDDDVDDDDYDAARSVDGSENNWGGSEHPSTDSRSVDLNSEDGCCNGSKGSKDGSKGSSSKGSKKGKKKKKFRLGGKKKSIMAQSKEGLPKQETVIEETHIESEDGSVIDDHFDYENDHHHQYETWDDDGAPLDVSENINDADDIYGYEDAEPKDRPKAFRKKGRRSSLGDTAWPPPPPPPPEEEHKSRRRNSLLASLLMGGSAHNVVPPPPPPPPEKEYPSPKSRGPSPKQRRPRRNSLFGSVYKTHDEEEQQPQKDQKASPKQQKPSPKQRRRRSMFGSSTDGESSIAGTASTQSPIPPKIPKDVHKIVNQERIAREMEPFHRNMLLDTLAQSLATDMSVGRQSGGCDYHGNVGQGVSLQMIHTTLMENRSGPARKNILSTKFTDFGMSVVPGRGPNEGILFMCQLFK